MSFNAANNTLNVILKLHFNAHSGCIEGIIV